MEIQDYVLKFINGTEQEKQELKDIVSKLEKISGQKNEEDRFKKRILKLAIRPQARLNSVDEHLQLFRDFLLAEQA